MPIADRCVVEVMSLSVARASIAVCLFRGLFTTEETPDKVARQRVSKSLQMQCQ